MAVPKAFIKIFAVTAFAMPWGCGSSSKDSNDATIHSTITVKEAVKEDDNGIFNLTAVSACSRDRRTNFFEASFRDGAGRNLDIAIAGFSSNPTTYNCEQAPSNRTEENELGDFFEGCMVDVKTLASSKAGKVSGYSMHRQTNSIRPFTYTGKCSISITTVEPAIVGEIDCRNMVNSIVDGAPRNPSDERIKANVTGDFSCVPR